MKKTCTAKEFPRKAGRLHIEGVISIYSISNIDMHENKLTSGHLNACLFLESIIGGKNG
jgi:hypothetical protein